MSQNTQLYTPIGTRALGEAWHNVQKCFAYTDLDGQIITMQILAATTGDQEITDKFKQWKKEIEETIKKMQIGQPNSRIEAIRRKQKIHTYRETKHLEIYEKLIFTLKTKKLLEYNLNTIKPVYPSRPTAGE